MDTSKSEPAVAREVAEQEFARFVELMDLDVEPEKMDAEDRQAFEKERGRFVDAVMAGTLVVNERGEPVFNPESGGGPVTFHEPTGAALMAMDAKREGAKVAKQMAVLAAVTGRNQELFSKMPNRDLRVCNAIINLFLG